jgi:hypothetical protein
MSYSIIEDIEDMLGPNAHQVPKNMRQPPSPVHQTAIQMMNSTNLGNFNNAQINPASGRYNNLDNYHSYEQKSFMHDRNDVASKYYEKKDKLQPRLQIQRSSLNDIFESKPKSVDINFREEEINISTGDKKDKKDKKENVKIENIEKYMELHQMRHVEIFHEIQRMSTVFTNLLQRHDQHVDLLRKKMESIEMTQKGILFLLFIILLLVLLKSNHVVSK